MTKKRFSPGKIVVVLYLSTLILPFYFLIVTALKPSTELYTNPIGWPTEIAWGNFIEAFKQANLLQYGLNSIIVTGVSVALILIIDVLCAYGLFKLSKTRIGSLLYGFTLLGLIIPVVGYGPILAMVRSFGLSNLSALIVLNVAGSVPFAMLILVGFLKTIPKEILEAAKMDGCSDTRMLLKVIVPILKPAIATITIINIVNTWNNFLTPMLVIRNKEFYTITVGLMNFKGNWSIQYNLMFAAILIVAIPLLVIFIIFQKKFTESLAGSVKG